jgi:hypothetical protein
MRAKIAFFLENSEKNELLKSLQEVTPEVWQTTQQCTVPRVVDPDPDPAGSVIICMFGSGSVINFGSGSGSGSGSKCSRFPTYGTVAISIKENRFKEFPYVFL